MATDPYAYTPIYNPLDPNPPKPGTTTATPIDQPLYSPASPAGTSVNATPAASQDPNSPYYNPGGTPTSANNAPWQTTDPNAPYYDPPGWKGGTFKTGWDTLDSALNTATGSGHISDISNLYNAVGGDKVKGIIPGQPGTNVGGLLDYGTQVQAGTYNGRPAPAPPGANPSGGGGALPPGTTSYGTGLANETAGQLARSGARAGELNAVGTANQGAMAGAAANMGAVGGYYSGQGVNDYNQNTADRTGQLYNTAAATNAANQSFGTSAAYGGSAANDYASQAALGSAQQRAAGVSGQAGAGMFTGGSQYGQQAQGDYGAEQMARIQQIAAGQQGSNYGAANMGQAAAYGQQAGQVGNALNQTQGAQMGYGGAAGGVSAGNQATSNSLLGGAAQAFGAQAQGRSQAEQSLGRLQQFYQQGPGPSAAEAQLKQSTDQNMAQAIALAHSGRGAGDNSAAMRQAMFSNAATQQQAAGQGAQLRAQEAATWRGQQLGAMGQEQSALGNLRGQDISVGGQQLGSAAQFAGLGYQGLGLGAQQANTVGGQQLGQLNAYLGAQGTQGGLGYQGVGLGAQQADQARAQDLAARGQSLGQQTSMYGLGFQGLGQQQAALGQARGQDLSAYGTNVAAQGQFAGQGYQGLGLAQQGYTAARGQDLSAMANNNQTGLGYQQLGQGYQQLGLQNQLGYSGLANQQTLTGDQLAQQAAQAQLSADTSRYGVDRGIGIQQQQLNQQQSAADKAFYASLIAGGVGLLSDVRAKKNITPYDSTPGGADLRPAQGYSYDYKDPGAPGAMPGRQYGPMAQDLEQTPAGASVVRTGPDGKKSIDTSRLSLVNTSAISEQQRRLDRLEQLAGGKKLPQLPAAGKARSDLEPTAAQLARDGGVYSTEFGSGVLPTYDGTNDPQDSVDALGTAAPDPDKRRVGRADMGEYNALIEELRRHTRGTH